MPYPLTDSTPSDYPPGSLVRAELDRILASELFTRSERLSAFLKFIVDQTLAGQGDSLKEQVIAVELYGKGADFNTAADPIVRVDARRLRDRLRGTTRRRPIARSSSRFRKAATRRCSTATPPMSRSRLRRPRGIPAPCMIATRSCRLPDLPRPQAQRPQTADRVDGGLLEPR